MLPIQMLALPILVASASMPLRGTDGPPVPAVAPPVAPHAEAPAAAPERVIVDLAILLDTSGSMNGLLDAARQRLWAIVNDFATASPLPDLRIALLTYGNNGHTAGSGWVKVHTDLTDDLDLVSQELFAQTLDGGTELVARVIEAARTGLSWRSGENPLRIMVVAGNESADQDHVVPFRDACRAAIADGIIVNAIYCGNEADTIAPGWREVAQLADGMFASIDQDLGAVAVATPFDDELARLSTLVNATYIPFGTLAESGQMRQTAQDGNAGGASGWAGAERAVSKSAVLYCNRAWDLVDACRDASFRLEDVRAEDLPEGMRTMTMEERRAYIAGQTEKRGQIHAQIQESGRRRAAWIAEQAAEARGPSFGDVLRRAIRAQATAKGIRFPVDEPVASAAGGAAEAGDSGGAGEAGHRGTHRGTVGGAGGSGG